MYKSFALFVLLILASCNSNNDKDGYDEQTVIMPDLLSMTFYVDDNALQLSKDVEGKVIGDSIVEFWIPNMFVNKCLVPSITAEGCSEFYFDGQSYKKGTAYDFTRPVVLTIENELAKKNYKVLVHSFTGLPIINITTEGKAPIVSQDNYLNAKFVLTENVTTRAAGDVIDTNVKIKGRGNSTWQFFEKKPYRLKFDDKVSLLGEHEDKAWVLLANAYDKTMLRNQIGFYLSSISNLEYTPKSHFVELILNEQYWGTYQLTEKLKIAKHRVNAGDDGFLLEVDMKAKADEPTFMVPHLSCPVNIKDPDVVVGDEKYNYIKQQICALDSILYSDNYTSMSNGWQKYFDVNSFVDWYLINEICKLTDAPLLTSCYMSISKGGKLKMGPVWDFDSFINYDEMDCSPEGFYVKNASWFIRMFSDIDFVNRVKERYNYFYSRKNDLYKEINEYADYLQLSIVENNNKWSYLYNKSWKNNSVWGSYENEIGYLKDWLDKRFEWLKIEFDKM